MTEHKSELSFEEAVARLEQIVTEMESGTLPLDECLNRFQQAVALSRHCAERLDVAEREIRSLTREGGLERLESFPGEGTPDEGE